MTRLTTPAELYERLQEQLEADAARCERRTKEARAIRRYVGEQPKRLVVLDRLTSPGTPYEQHGTLVGGTYPKEWVGSMFVTRLEARRA